MRKRHFTLIELLTVVAIIAILIALLLPVLGRAKESAKRVVCAGNLRQTGMAVTMYAEEFGNRLPATEIGTFSENKIHHTHWTYYIYAMSEFHGLGRLYSGDVVSDGQIFYCPSQESKGNQYETFTPWFTPVDKMDGFGPRGRAGLTYNPHVDTGTRIRLYDKLQEFPPESVLALDLLVSVNLLSHLQEGSNVMYGDCSVAFQPAEPLIAIMLKDPSGFARTRFDLWEQALTTLEQ